MYDSESASHLSYCVEDLTHGISVFLGQWFSRTRLSKEYLAVMQFVNYLSHLSITMANEIHEGFIVPHMDLFTWIFGGVWNEVRDTKAGRATGLLLVKVKQSPFYQTLQRIAITGESIRLASLPHLYERNRSSQESK
jgi:hypothetical protein